MIMAAGVFAAMLTPQEAEGAIHRQGFARLALWLLDHGCHGVVPFGTTGEFASFTTEERIAALDRLIEDGVPANRILVGTGAAAVADAARLSRHATERGCLGILVAPPFYFKEVGEDGLFAAYARIVEASGEAVRLYLYHFPAMSAVPIRPGLLERLLAAWPRQVAGLKDSSGDFGNTKAIVARFPQLSVFTGDDDLLLPLLRAGGAGSITAGANIAARLLAEIHEGWQEGGPTIEAHQRALQDLWSGLLLKYPVTEALKEILAAETGDTGWLPMRPPLGRLPESARRDLLRSFRALPITLAQSQHFILGEASNGSPYLSRGYP
ncbi:dihydrodipicolinate synthase family protein [Hypericibacter terrae]|uniref:Dihydrodipicolinate synthase family protein n=2 Tax=Hypericibacter terrae TaxID=2602015 RepID=A0A5J6MX98_9PROT|nr:dihydrodipicolinate synthase family protein [Hypericibacter terrae]